MATTSNNIRDILVGIACALCLALPVTAQSAIITFHFTGNIMVADPNNQVIYNHDASGTPMPLTPISATLDYNTVTGIGGSDLSIEMIGGFWNAPATFHDITMQHVAGTNTVNGNILVDWQGNLNMPMHIDWNATGFLNAIAIGLDVGDTISGSTLQKDTDNDGFFDAIFDVSSATPFSDEILFNLGIPISEGPAPLAATAASQGLGYDINGIYIGGTPFDGIRGLINIGSGNSMTVTSISNVPVPAAVWLFGSGLIGLIGIARRESLTNKY